MFYGFEIRQAPLQIKLNDFPKKLQPIVTKMPQHGHPSFRRGNCDKVSVSTKSEPRSDSRASENSTTKRCCLSLICLSSSNDQPCEHTPDLMHKSLSFCLAFPLSLFREGILDYSSHHSFSNQGASKPYSSPTHFSPSHSRREAY